MPSPPYNHPEKMTREQLFRWAQALHYAWAAVGMGDNGREGDFHYCWYILLWWAARG